jgi:hypothetical protein
MHSLAIKARGETEQKRGTRVEKWRKHKENRGREKDLKIHRKQKTERGKNRELMKKRREKTEREDNETVRGRQREESRTEEKKKEDRGEERSRKQENTEEIAHHVFIVIIFSLSLKSINRRKQYIYIYI